MNRAPVQQALQKVTALLDEARIPYALVGAMALNEHGYERVTTDVDLLLTAEGLATFKRLHLGRGYLEKFPGSRGLRDTEHDVPIDILITGDYPGDGKPKPVAFPDPAVVADVGARLKVLPLPKLIEIKIASGLTAPHRLRDLADVLEVIRRRDLPLDLAAQLSPFVREKYAELWTAAQGRTSNSPTLPAASPSP